MERRGHSCRFTAARRLSERGERRAVLLPVSASGRLKTWSSEMACMHRLFRQGDWRLL